ncbi:MAG: ADOP family duplicated permease [Gemmatimonadaceae bacterium]
MRSRDKLWRRYLRFFGADPKADADDELRFHLEELERGYTTSGMSAPDASRAARAQFGSVDEARRNIQRGSARMHRRVERAEWWRSMAFDTRLAARKLWHQPGFTAAAIVTLALGIGANAAVFSVVNTTLLRPLPYGEPGRIVKLYTSLRGHEWVASPPDFMDWQSRTHAFTAMGAMYEDQPTLTGHGDPTPLEGTYVTRGFFDAMGVHPSLGHPFTTGEETYGQTDAVILSHGVWQRLFGGRADVIGRSLQLDGVTRRIAGVMPKGFDFPDRSELWLPLAFSDTALATQRGAHYLDVVARLRPGATVESASGDINGVAHQLAAEYPRTNKDHYAEAMALRDALVGPSSRQALWILLGAVALVALIACVNVANLLLARGASRQREFAVRTALGAQPRDLIGMAMVESLMLALMGGVAAVVVGFGATRAMHTIRPASLDQFGPAGIDVRVLGFTFALSLVTGLLFGLAPAVQAARASRLQGTMQSGGRGGTIGKRGWRVRGTLVAGELALAMILLAGAGLLIRSFARLQRVPAGFDASHVLTFGLSLPDSRYPTPEQSEIFYERVLTGVRGLPGVTSVAAVSGVPLSGFNYSITTRAIDGQVIPDADQPSTQIRIVTPGYFKTLGIAMTAGHAFTDADRNGAPNVALVNEAAAKLLWKGVNPVGHTMEIGTTFGLGRGRAGGEVIGVVHDVHDEELQTAPRPTVYIAHAQFPVSSMTVVTKTAPGIDPLRLATGLRQQLHQIDPDLPVLNVSSMRQIVGQSVEDPRFAMLLLGTFAALALLLAAIGVYGVMAYVVGQRTREIGVRMALGASGPTVVGETVRRAAPAVLGGVAAGVLGALALTKLMARLLYEVKPADVGTFAVMTAGLIAISALSAWLPARRASRVDPVTALRAE